MDEAVHGGEVALEQVLADELLEDEVVLWSGRPDPSVQWHTGELIVVPISILWAGLTAFLVAGAVHSLTDPPLVDGVPRQIDTADVVFWMLMSSFFVASAAYGLVGRFVWQAYDRRRTRFVMTDRRLLDIEVNGRRRVGSLPLDRVVGIRTESRADGRGSVAFGDSSRGTPSRSVLGEAAGMRFGPQANADASVVFRDVDDARGLVALLRARRVGIGRSIDG